MTCNRYVCEYEPCNHLRTMIACLVTEITYRYLKTEFASHLIIYFLLLLFSNYPKKYLLHLQRIKSSNIKFLYKNYVCISPHRRNVIFSVCFVSISMFKINLCIFLVGRFDVVDLLSIKVIIGFMS